MNQNHELKENENGILELYVNGSACVCPFGGQQVFPMQGRIAGQIDLQVFNSKCTSLCPLLEFKPVDSSIGRTFATVELKCANSYLNKDIDFVPYKKKSNLTIH